MQEGSIFCSAAELNYVLLISYRSSNLYVAFSPLFSKKFEFE